MSLITISEVARRSGVAASALRYYEERGLITSERTGAGHRRFPRAVLRRIAFIVYAQRIGLTLEEIGAELAKLPQSREPTRDDWSYLMGPWKARIRARVAELERLESGLTQCIGCGCLSLDRCRLANPDDRASRLGPGPRYWLGDDSGGGGESEAPPSQRIRCPAGCQVIPRASGVSVKRAARIERRGAVSARLSAVSFDGVVDLSDVI